VAVAVVVIVVVTGGCSLINFHLSVSCTVVCWKRSLLKLHNVGRPNILQGVSEKKHPLILLAIS